MPTPIRGQVRLENSRVAVVRYVKPILGRPTLAACLTAAICLGSAHAAAVCSPPVPPFVPESDEAFEEYADLISREFEAYFTDMTRYSACLDQARAELLAEAREVSRLYKDFLARADALGLTARAAIVAEPSPDDPIRSDGIEPGLSGEYQTP